MEETAPDQQEAGKQCDFIIKWNSKHAYSSSGSSLYSLTLFFVEEWILFRSF